jgi:glutamate-5-semialdehyde dehydrogenase
MSEITTLAHRARDAANALAATSSDQRNRALLSMSHALVAKVDEIIAANEKDMQLARDKNTAPSLLDRLELNPSRVKSMSEALKSLALLPDPIGEVISGSRLANGIWLQQVRVPMGVVAIIYEARPNVTADAAGLSVKTANAVILRGGSLAANSNLALARVLSAAAVGAGLPDGCIQYVETPGREAAEELMSLHGMIDVLIPRGGAGLIKSVVENAKAISTCTRRLTSRWHSASS